ncbi:hypothetical protein M422DRAFT_256838 [Sphaerobolus stellatus SS14]|uniref:Uncharacterized protein n=1 Tax=Sphaerobolus stellatus (strain SS14) TaxID=990650 RepID=A0A0C9UZJ0_SPHS4|nr:hypothetical protein M422DRAFT_256838 [Sphaerobolus stellatus SS14]
MLAFTLFSSLLVASQIAASPFPSAPSALLSILRRQSPSIPSVPDDCTTQCTPIVNIGTDVDAPVFTTFPDVAKEADDFTACTCNAAYGQAFLACAQCTANLPDVDLRTDEEGLVQDLNTLCSLNGHPFNPPLALSGSSSSSSNSSSSSTTTGTGSTGTTGSGASTPSSSTGTSTGTTSSSSTDTSTGTTSAPTTITTSNSALAAVSINGLVIAGVTFGIMILSLSGSY